MTNNKRMKNGMKKRIAALLSGVLTLGMVIGALPGIAGSTVRAEELDVQSEESYAVEAETEIETQEAQPEIAVQAATTTVPGSGTAEDPYIVSTSDDLEEYLPKGYVKLDSDIVLDVYFVSLYSENRDIAAGLDLNGHILDMSSVSSSSGILVRAASGQKLSLEITDSNPAQTHDAKYVTNDGTPITGGIITGFNCQHNGGGKTCAILVDGADFTMTGGTFFKNKSKEGGTCVGIGGESNVKITGVNFYNNECTYWSSCIWFSNYGSNSGKTLEIKNCKFMDNNGYYSSVICTEAGSTLIENCVIQNNTSKEYGAVNFEGTGTMTIKDTVITGNVNTEASEKYDSYEQTAGVYLEPYQSPQLTLDGKVIIKDNTINGEQRNLYCSKPVTLGSSFDSKSEIGVLYRSYLYDDTDAAVINNIGSFADCFTSDVDEAELYVKEAGLNVRKLSHVHTSSDWIVDEEATTTSAGSKHKECTSCKEVLETAVIPKLEVKEPEAGKVEKRITETLVLNNGTASLGKAILTDQESELIKNGADALIYTNLATDVSKSDQEKVNAALGSLSLGRTYDITLWVQVGDNAARQITSTSDKMSLSLKVDDELINKDSSIVRTYKVIRIHDGAATVLDGTYDEKTQMFTFETDQFSTYALVYSDAAVTTTTTTPATTTDTVTAGTTAAAVAAAAPSPVTDVKAQLKRAPKTGDTNPSVWMFAIIIIAGAGLAGYGVRKYKVNR